ncbi:MAG TPA: molybdopterin-dependent oxidoreductase, partial [Myxococcales bacterium]|nr:molybdopterin-dependent oxidoreductase [Myxococcales bacterium]
MGAGQIDIDLIRSEPPNEEAGEGAFACLLTPAQRRFIRCNFPVPEMGPAQALEIAGAVIEPRRLSLSELRALRAVRLTVVTECAGNGRSHIVPPADGEPWRDGAVSTAQWTGVPLSSVLQLRDTAVEVVFTGADGGEYQRSLPREVAMDHGTLLAWEMNGAPIPPVFGGPLRLIVPGWYGMASVKWLARVEAVERPFEGKFQSGRYVYAPGVPVTRIRVKAMFTGVATSRIAGLAWGGAGIAAVDVCVDGVWLRAR